MRRIAALAAAALLCGFGASACAHHDDGSDRSMLQLPVYPGATVVGISPAMRAKNAGHVLEVFVTWDAFDKVRDWYAAQMPRQTQSVVNEKQREATFALFDDRRRAVHLEMSGDQVVIYLSGAAEPAVNGR